jgi:hypothetical protein
MSINKKCALCENKGYFLTAIGFEECEKVFCPCPAGVLLEMQSDEQGVLVRESNRRRISQGRGYYAGVRARNEARRARGEGNAFGVLI